MLRSGHWTLFFLIVWLQLILAGYAWRLNGPSFGIVWLILVVFWSVIWIREYRATKRRGGK